MFNKIKETAKSLQSIYYSIKRTFKSIKYNIKQFFVKLFRGFSDPEWVDFHYYNAKWCLPKIKYLKENYRGGPVNTRYPEIKTFSNWNWILGEIIWGFEFIIRQYEDMDFEPTEKEWDRMFRSMEYFGKYYWDLND